MHSGLNFVPRVLLCGGEAEYISCKFSPIISTHLILF